MNLESIVILFKKLTADFAAIRYALGEYYQEIRGVVTQKELGQQSAISELYRYVKLTSMYEERYMENTKILELTDIHVDHDHDHHAFFMIMITKRL